MIINGKNTNQENKKTNSKGLSYYQNLKPQPSSAEKETISDKMNQLWVEDMPSQTQSVSTNKTAPALRTTLAQKLATGVEEKPATPTVNLPTILTKYADIYNDVKNQPKTKTPTSSDNPYKATSVKDFVNQVQSGTLPKTTPTLLPTNAQMDAATLERNEKLNKANFGYANELERLNQERDSLNKQLKEAKNNLNIVNNNWDRNVNLNGLNTMTELKQKLENDTLNLQNKLSDIDTNIKKEQLNYNYDNAKYDTSFAGKFGANYSIGKLNEEANKAWSKYLNNKTQANKEYAEALSNQINKFTNNNTEALNGNGFISKSAANYLPQLINQTGAGLKGAAAGGLAAGGAASGLAAIGGQLGPQAAFFEELATIPGAFIWGATKGGKVGYVAGVGKYSYDNMQGAAFKSLLDLGVDEETATKAAKDEALISSIIEMADAGFDIALLGIGKLIDLAGKNGLKLLAKEGAKETAEKAGKKFLKELGKYGVVKYGANILQEGAEEASQELVSIANENRLKNGNANTGKLNLIGNTVKQAFNLTDEEKKRVTESAKEGGKVALMFGGATELTTSRVNNSLSNNLRNDIPKTNAQNDVQTVQNNAGNEITPVEIKAPENGNMNVTGQNTVKQQIESTINNNNQLTQEEKQGLLQILEESSNNLTPDAINFFNDTINNLQNNRLEQVTNTEDKKATYKKYLNDKTELDKTALETAKDSVPANKSGRRTKEQWLKVANTIGQQIYDLSDAEIERYAYRSWQETHPNQAGNLNRQGKGFVKFTSDEWIDAITKSAQQTKAQTQVNQANNVLPTERSQATLESAKQVGMTDIDIKKANDLNNLLRSGAKLVFYDENNIPEVIVGSENIKKAKDGNGFYYNGTVYINKNSPKVVQQILGHELTHHTENSSIYNDMAKYIFNSNAFYEYMSKRGFNNIAEYEADLKDRKYTAKDFKREMIAEFCEEELFTNQESINRLARENRTLAQKIKNWISDMLVNIKGKTVEKELRKIESMYNKALNETANNNIESSNISMSIETIPNTNKKYVKADRQVISGDDVSLWGKQVENYINEKIRNNQDVNVLAEDGTLLTITEDTAGKAKFRNEVKMADGNTRYLTDGELLAKLRAETHIDELAEISKKVGEAPDYKKHNFAKDGFEYRNAYFEDIDGKYYRITMSVGKNGAINTIYNIGLMKNTKKNRSNSSLLAQRPNGNTSAVEELTSNNNIQQNNKSVNTEYAQENKKDTAADKPAFSLPSTDSQGRTLSKQQQEYFKDSKVRDENGELKVMYRGSNDEINIFDTNRKTKRYTNFGTEYETDVKGFFFTENKEYAEGFGEVKEYYLNSKKPLALNNNIDDLNKIFKPMLDDMLENGHIYEWQYESAIKNNTIYNRFIDENGISWETIDEDNFNKSLDIMKELGYDSIIVDEGDDNDQSILVFNSNQIKNVDNTAPTANEDIRFSISTPVEKTKDLIAVHNISEDKLQGILELGGFPVPSIAITNPSKVNHNSFGEISVIFDKSAIDPANKANEVYDRDVWSPTFPRVDYEINTEGVEEIADKIGIEDWRLADYAEESDNPQDLVAKILHNRQEVIDKFIEENNIKYDTEYKEAKAHRAINDNPELKNWIKNNNINLWELSQNSKLKDKYYQIIDLDLDSDLRKTLDNCFELWAKDGKNNMPRFLTSFEADFNMFKNNITRQIDAYETSKNKKEAAKKGGIEKYLLEQIRPMFGEKGIYNGKEYLTPSGNRKSFWQLHEEYNLPNIVKALTKGKTKGEQKIFSTGYGHIQSQMAQRFKSIDNIKANKNLITNLDEENQILKQARANIENDVERIADKYKQKDSYSNEFSLASELIADFASRGKLTVADFNDMTSHDYEWFDKIDNSTVEKLITDLKALRSLPTDYFEAKPQRAVGFDEVKAVVVPQTINSNIKQSLIDAGLNVVEYDPKIENDRQRVINSLDDVKFSLKDDMDKLNEEYGSIKPGENPARDVKIPKKTGKNQYVSQYARTLAEAGVTTEQALSTLEKEIVDGKLSHEKVTDKRSLKYAENYIKDNGWEEATKYWDSLVRTNKEVSKDDLAIGILIYNNAVQAKDVTRTIKMIGDLTAEASEAGRTLQATRLLKKMTPDGRLYALERSVAKINQGLQKQIGDFTKDKEVTISEELAKELLEAKTPKEIDIAVEKIQQHIADQVPPTWTDKLNAWRYLAMLGNPRTHIRNIAGNALMIPVKNLKNEIGTVLEKTLPKEQRTKAILNPLSATDNALKSFAANDFDQNAEMVRGESKYDIKAGIREKQRIFSTEPLERLRKANFNALEAEDAFFLKMHYAEAFAEALKARGITVEDARNGTAEMSKTLAEIREIATNEAQKATYRDFNALAQKIAKGKRYTKNNAQSSPTVGGKLAWGALNSIILEGALPFAKTPANIVRRGIEYSPIGLAAGIGDALINVKKGKITATQAIDKISAGLSGTAIVGLGMLLAKLGLVSGGDNEDKKERYFEEMTGLQSYALNLGKYNYTIDWSAPASMPLFVGVELWNAMQKENADFEDALTAFGKISEPVFELSMLQGINNIIKSASYGENPAYSIGTGLAGSYASQYNPTVLGQVARTIDDTRRTTYEDKNKSFSKLRKFGQQQLQKIPFANQTLLPRYDQFGRKDVDTNVLRRAFENFISPGYISEDKSTPVENELSRVYKQTGEKGVLPSYAAKNVTVNGEKINFTQKQYEEYTVTRGQTAYEQLSKMFETNQYQKLSDKDKQELIEDVYTYANEYAKSKVTDFEFSKTSKNGKVNTAAQHGINPYQYLMTLQTADTDNNGYVSQKEFESAVKKSDLTASQRAYLIGLNKAKK